MTEEEIRTLVREVIARRNVAAPGPYLSGPPTLLRQHASHAMFVLPAGSEMEGPCLIEPAVKCNHCGYCKSYGH